MRHSSILLGLAQLRPERYVGVKYSQSVKRQELDERGQRCAHGELCQSKNHNDADPLTEFEPECLDGLRDMSVSVYTQPIIENSRQPTGVIRTRCLRRLTCSTDEPRQLVCIS